MRRPHSKRSTTLNPVFSEEEVEDSEDVQSHSRRTWIDPMIAYPQNGSMRNLQHIGTLAAFEGNSRSVTSRSELSGAAFLA